MRASRFLGGILAVAVVLVASGCGGSGKTVKVEGKVTLDGTPLEGAGVTFIPVDGNGPEAKGITGKDGVFRLTTYTFGDGALPGEYKVVIAKMEEGGTAAEPAPAPNDPAAAKQIYEKMMKKNPSGLKPKKSSLHANYTDLKRTTLKCRVPPDGAVVFPLTSEGN